ncbi:LRAT domain [Dillenia turbinata]|uniref:LRAT domain n=1 Tax=Dillenia turbinata TaxID=194707 RepID=A0AAN8V0L4_9MAGN
MVNRNMLKRRRMNDQREKKRASQKDIVDRNMRKRKRMDDRQMLKRKRKRIYKYADEWSMLKRGDHIYRYGDGKVYTHHGIYVGDGMVIHYTRTEPGSREIMSPATSIPCPKCNFQSDLHRGVARTCTDCFLSGYDNHVRLFEYGVPLLKLIFRPSGTCGRSHRRPHGEAVVRRAYYLLATNGFGCYKLFHNNCEDFARYCKTGKRKRIFQAKWAIDFLKLCAVAFVLYLGQKICFPHSPLLTIPTSYLEKINGWSMEKI